jgi:putative transposase
LFIENPTNIFAPDGVILCLEILNLFMADTYVQLYIHFVFAVKNRTAIIHQDWEERLHKYITGIIQNNGHKLLAINSATDHIHIFIGLSPKQSVSDLMRLVKGDSAEFVNKEKLTIGKFHWQEGYGAFTNSHSQLSDVIKYISNQKQHHSKRKFKDEYLDMLKAYDVEYNEKYIFQDLAD